MTNAIATREAIERFEAELPAAGVTSDRLRRLAGATRALLDQATATPGGESPWADHNLAVTVATGLGDSATRSSSQRLFLGVRRRLQATLERDPDDLAAALALARGAAGALDDDRLTADIALVVASLSRPQAGAQLVSSVIALAVAAGNRRGKAPATVAAREAASSVRDAAERVSARLPNHPRLALDRVRLELLAARAAETDERQAALDRVHGLANDHEARFGPTAALRKLRAEHLELRARSGGGASDIRKEALEAFRAAARDRSLGPKLAMSLIGATRRAGALDKQTARALLQEIDGLDGTDDERWLKARAELLQETGDQAQLIKMWEESLLANPEDRNAARGLAKRLLSNLRDGLASPFESPVLERILNALGPKDLARWSAHDVGAVVGLASETFGASRALGFVTERLLSTRELRKAAWVWDHALTLARDVATPEEALTIASDAVDASGLPAARFLIAERLLADGRDLHQAANILGPLLQAKGEVGARAQTLQKQILSHPKLRHDRRDGLVAFEERIGVGTDREFDLAVTYLTRSWLLVDLVGDLAPADYSHKHLRAMVRDQDLPKGVSVGDLRKGDLLRAKIVGKDAEKGKRKDDPRVYWIRQGTTATLKMSVAEIAGRWETEEKAFGIGTGQPVQMKIRREKDGTKVLAQLRASSGKGEFGLRPVVPPELLPEGMQPDRLGKGKTVWGLVEREVVGRRYKVAAALTTTDPNAALEPAPADEAPADVPEAPKVAGANKAPADAPEAPKAAAADAPEAPKAAAADAPEATEAAAADADAPEATEAAAADSPAEEEPKA